MTKKKPLAIKITVSLLILYGIIDFISNYIDSFYVSHSGGFFDISGTGFNSFNQLGFIITSIPILLLFIAAIFILRGGKIGHGISIILLLLSIPAALGGLSYLILNIPKFFSQDLLYLTKSPTVTSWLLDNSIGNFTSVNSLFAYRILIIKSFLKAMIEIISCGYLTFIVMEHESSFKNK